MEWKEWKRIKYRKYFYKDSKSGPGLPGQKTTYLHESHQAQKGFSVISDNASFISTKIDSSFENKYIKTVTILRLNSRTT